MCQFNKIDTLECFNQIFVYFLFLRYLIFFIMLFDSSLLFREELNCLNSLKIIGLFLFAVFEQPDRRYVVHFNSKPPHVSKKSVNNKDTSSAEGPVIERVCVKCGNDKMSYATLQLRSADEGQTVFFTCTKCG